jgi:hypothetical protein
MFTGNPVPPQILSGAIHIDQDGLAGLPIQAPPMNLSFDVPHLSAGLPNLSAGLLFLGKGTRIRPANQYGGPGVSPDAFYPPPPPPIRPNVPVQIVATGVIDTPQSWSVLVEVVLYFG